MIPADEKKQIKPKSQQPVSGAKVRKPAQTTATGKPGLTDKKMNNVQRAGKQAQTQPPHLYQAQRDSKEPWGLYMMVIGACVLLIVSYALYMSSATSKGWAPVPETGGSFEPTPVVATQPQNEPEVEAVEQPLSSSNVVSPPIEIVQQSIRPNATVDVPNLRLRKMPDMTGKVTFGDLKRGERVEIVKRFAGKGPEWVKIKTKSGKAGWVFASLVKEGKRK